MSDHSTRVTADRLTTTWANDRAAIGLALAEIDPSLGTIVAPLADGQLVLCGPGMYVNTACGCGRAAPLTDDAWTTIVERAGQVGVTASIEIGPTTQPDTRAAAVAQGYVAADARDAYVRSLDPADDEGAPIDGGIDVDIVEIDESGLGIWQQAAGEGFAHDDPAQRAISDLWARAALRAGDRMFVALDRRDRRPLASSIVHLTDGVATLGGMSTVPSARGRGIQMLMLRHRLRIAREAGCELAASTAANPVSARNLVRAGFERVFTIETWLLHE